MDPELIADYRDAILRGDRMPHVSVVFDGVYFFLTDGWHRCLALEAAGKCEVEADVVSGTYRDAQLASFAANSRNGARRSNADKRLAVQRLLDDPEWAQWSNEAIAKACVVSAHTVAEVRHSISAFAEIPATRTVERNGTIYQQDTTKIGKAQTTRVAAIKQPAAPVVAASVWPFPIVPVDPAANPDAPVSTDVNPEGDEQADAPEVHAPAEPEVAAPAVDQEVAAAENGFDAVIEPSDKSALRDELTRQKREIAQLKAELLTLKEFRDEVGHVVADARTLKSMRDRLRTLLNRLPLVNRSAASADDQSIRDALERRGQMRLDEQGVALHGRVRRMLLSLAAETKEKAAGGITAFAPRTEDRDVSWLSKTHGWGNSNSTRRIALHTDAESNSMFPATIIPFPPRTRDERDRAAPVPATAHLSFSGDR
ncbi:hypothetical protein CUJ90_28265 [Paraburkholderia terricola]|nr:hypothetical protein CUJ90_28265 [Paraburkholderia terricola]